LNNQLLQLNEFVKASKTLSLIYEKDKLHIRKGL